MKEQIKAPEKIQLSNEEIANLSDTEFKTLVIRMLSEMVEHGHKIEEKVKAMKSEIKEKYRDPTVTRRKLGLKSMVWTRRKKETFNQNRMKKQEFKKMRKGVGTCRTTLNVLTSKSYGSQKEKRKSKKLKTYLKTERRRIYLICQRK